MSTEQKPKQAELSSNSVTATDGRRRVLLQEERLTQKTVSKIQQKTNKNTLRAPTAPRSTPRQLVSPILLKDTASNRRPARLLHGLNKTKKRGESLNPPVMLWAEPVSIPPSLLYHGGCFWTAAPHRPAHLAPADRGTHEHQRKKNHVCFCLNDLISLKHETLITSPGSVLCLRIVSLVSPPSQFLLRLRPHVQLGKKKKDLRPHLNTKNEVKRCEEHATAAGGDIMQTVSTRWPIRSL